MTVKASGLRVAGLFAGIGGIELGFERAGHHSDLLCEIEPGAAKVLQDRFPDTDLVGDVRAIKRLPAVDLMAAGFPCQDLSQAGRTAGIFGGQSGLVQEVFRLLQGTGPQPTWLLLENVPFMLQLDRGQAMKLLVDELEALGFRWAYRVVNTQGFGLPQRRRRVLLLASRTEDPRPVLFADDAGLPRWRYPDDVACGFYWTEGLRGLGWAVDAVPTMKGGSSIGIASPPGVWLPKEHSIVTPEIRDAERLQGFPAGWTEPAVAAGGRAGHRWKLVGNAVSVPVAEWLGGCLLEPKSCDHSEDVAIKSGATWPSAAWGEHGLRRRSFVSEFPIKVRRQGLTDFLRYPTTPLSVRATSGFLSRANTGTLRFAPSFLEDVERHLARVTLQHVA